MLLVFATDPMTKLLAGPAVNSSVAYYRRGLGCGIGVFNNTYRRTNGGGGTFLPNHGSIGELPLLCRIHVAKSNGSVCLVLPEF